MVLRELSKLHMFKRVPKGDLKRFIELSKPINYGIGDCICRQGEQATNAMLLVSGRLEVSIQTDSTVKHIGVIHPGEIFGEQGLFHSKGKRNATVLANRPSQCLTLTPDVMRLSHDNKAIGALERHLIATMARRIRSTNKAIQVVWKDAEQEEMRQKSNSQETKKTDQEDKGGSILNKLRNLFGGK